MTLMNYLKFKVESEECLMNLKGFYMESLIIEKDNIKCLENMTVLLIIIVRTTMSNKQLFS